MFRNITSGRVLFIGFCLGILSGVLSCDKDDGPNGPIPDILPSSFDLRAHQYISPVRDQNGQRPDGTSDLGSSVGLCWAFASLASLESNMLKQGMLPGPLYPGASLSPWYLGNYAGFNRPWYHYNSETIPGLEPPTGFGYYYPGFGWGGGGSFWTGDYLISGKELPIWDDCPMPNEAQTARQELYPPAGMPTRTYTLAQMPVFLADDYNSLEAYCRRIKEYLMEHGAIQAYVHFEAIDFPGMISQTLNGVTYHGSRFMDKTHFNMYTYEYDNLGSDFLTHAVAIVGWDDTRPINVGGHTTTGAWLVKDSQGESSWDQGYFWVAYDDLAVNIITSGLIALSGDDYKPPSTYQTHRGILSNLAFAPAVNTAQNCLELGEYGYLLNGLAEQISWAVVEFPLSQAEVLSAVGLFSARPGQVISLQVYRNDLQSNPLLTKEFNLQDNGYYLLSLGADIPFAAGQNLILALGYQPVPESVRLPLVYVHDPEHLPFYQSWFGTRSGASFQLTNYTDIDPGCAFFVQAVMRK